jgi:hypothetical protein
MTTVIDPISSFFMNLQQDMATELNALDACLQKAAPKNEEYKTLGNLLEMHNDVQSMPFLQASPTLSTRDLENATASIVWYLEITEKHYQSLSKRNTIPEEIAALGSARQALNNWVVQTNAWTTAEAARTPLAASAQQGMVTTGNKQTGKINQCAQKFLDLMTALSPPNPKELKQTQTLLSGERLSLSNNQISALTKNWGKVVELARAKLTGSTPTFSISDLFCIHTTLETLYDRLETNVTRTEVDIISPEI